MIHPARIFCCHFGNKCPRRLVCWRLGPQMMALLRAIDHSCNRSLGSRTWLEEAALGETLLFLCFLATTYVVSSLPPGFLLHTGPEATESRTCGLKPPPQWPRQTFFKFLPQVFCDSNRKLTRIQLKNSALPRSLQVIGEGSCSMQFSSFVFEHISTCVHGLAHTCVCM